MRMLKGGFVEVEWTSTKCRLLRVEALLSVLTSMHGCAIFAKVIDQCAFDEEISELGKEINFE